MKLFLYYASHSFVNQIKKLFRSWVAIFLVVCLVFGLLIGLGAGLLAEYLEAKGTESEAETPAPAPEEPTPVDPATVKAVVGLAVLGFALFIFAFAVWRADKSGSQIFLMADVNLLFAAPMKPQSVLLFRLMSQIFLLIFAGLWAGFQIPNLVLNAHLPLASALFGIPAWIFIIVYSQLISVFVYSVSATHPKIKKYVLPSLVAIVALLGGGLAVYKAQSGLSYFAAADRFFNFPYSEWVPVFGWLKGMLTFAINGELWKSFACAGLLLVGIFPLAWGIWRFKADFYEDAMAGAQVRSEKLEAASKSRFGVSSTRSKDRDEKIRRDGLWGSGAQMFFTKTLYNRFRFGILKIFTKTSLLYLAMAVLFSIFMTFILKAPDFWVAGFAFCAVAFFRALGDPLSTDMEKVCFQTVPASFHAKVFWSSMGGSVNTALDLLPAFLITAVFLRANVFVAIGMFLLALALDFYVGQVLLLIDLSLPTSIAPQVRQAISILFIYFGLVPPATILAVVGIFWSLSLAVWIAAASMTAIGFIVFAVSPLILERGRR